MVSISHSSDGAAGADESKPRIGASVLKIGGGRMDDWQTPKLPNPELQRFQMANKSH